MSNSQDLKHRTRQFALSAIRLVRSLPANATSKVIGDQLMRAATSIGANYRAACRARSRADFISKITIVEEEADECVYWLDLIKQSGLMHDDALEQLLQEADELTAIFTASGRTAKANG